MIADKTRTVETVEEFLRNASERVNHALEAVLPQEADIPSELHKAERYSVFAGGKRLRPALCLAAYEACGGRGEGAMAAACSLEMVSPTPETP